MIIQRWTAKMMPMQLPVFIQDLGSLNALYRKHSRVEWGRVHFELYSGHEIYMEREFPDVGALDADESAATATEIWEAKERLLVSVVPGTVRITHYRQIES